MSKIEAYVCDKCLSLIKAEEAIGISETADMFDVLKSFPPVNDPAKARVHHCMECYRAIVLLPAERHTDRKKDEKAYQQVMKELYYGLRNSTLVILQQRQAGKRNKEK